MNWNLKKLVFCLILPVLSLQILLQGLLIFYEMRKTIVEGIDDVLRTVSDTLGGFLHGDAHDQLLSPRDLSELVLSADPGVLWAIDDHSGQLVALDASSGRTLRFSLPLDASWQSITRGPDNNLYALEANGVALWELIFDGIEFVEARPIVELPKIYRRLVSYNAEEQTISLLRNHLEELSLNSLEVTQTSELGILESLETWTRRETGGWIGFDEDSQAIVYLSRNLIPEATVELVGADSVDIVSLLPPQADGTVFALSDSLMRIDIAEGEILDAGFPTGFYSMSDDYYVDARAAMFRMKDHLGLTYLYTQMLNDEGKIVYGVDATDIDDPDFCPPGTEDDIDPADYEILTDSVYHGGTYISDVQYWERWGYLKSAYAPIFNERGEVIAMTGVDLSAASVDTETRKATYAAILLGALFLLFSGSVSAWIALRLTRPIDSMKHSALLIAAGQYHRRMPEQGIFELKRLMEEFNALADVIEAKVVDMQRHYEGISRHTTLRTTARRLRERLQPPTTSKLFGILLNSNSLNERHAVIWEGNSKELFIWVIPNNGRAATDTMAGLEVQAVSRALLGQTTQEIAASHSVISREYASATLLHALWQDSVWKLQQFNGDDSSGQMTTLAAGSPLTAPAACSAGEVVRMQVEQVDSVTFTLPYHLEEVEA